MNIGTVSKVTMGKLLRRRVKCIIQAFPAHRHYYEQSLTAHNIGVSQSIDTIMNRL